MSIRHSAKHTLITSASFLCCSSSSITTEHSIDHHPSPVGYIVSYAVGKWCRNALPCRWGWLTPNHSHERLKEAGSRLFWELGRPQRHSYAMVSSTPLITAKRRCCCPAHHSTTVERQPRVGVCSPPGSVAWINTNIDWINDALPVIVTRVLRITAILFFVSAHSILI